MEDHRRAVPHLARVVVALLLASSAAHANGLNISNVSLTGQDTANDFILVQFDISWENSWRVTTMDPFNWDATWVFIKYRMPEGEWQHATLHTSGHTAAVGAVIETSSDGKGVFIYRSDEGTGDVNFVEVQLRWDYGVDGLMDSEADVDIAVLGIEMVYVPEGGFYVGDGTTTDVRGQLHDAGSTTTPFLIGSEDAITLGGTTAGNLGNNNTNGMIIPDDFNNTTTQLLPAAYPKGYAAFYIMKYEISQGQYAQFLNLVTSVQAANRIENLIPTTYRYTITGSHPNYTAGAPDRACNFLNWADGVAYADWAGLRPMTDLEYEKACRGTLPPVADEYAWGNTSIHASTYAISQDGLPNATISNPGSGTGNASYTPTDGSIDGPLRVGIFAASFPNPTHPDPPSRAEAGATYYGVMEMSGNLWERFVTIGNDMGRGFDGMHGDGTLAADGHADAATWPGADAVGGGFRGSCWGCNSSALRVSWRRDAAAPISDRKLSYGWRLVRSAP